MAQNLSLFLPELVVIITLIAVLISDLLVSKGEGQVPLFFGLFGLAIALALLPRTTGLPEQLYFSGMLSADRFTHFFRLFFLLVAAFALCYGYKSKEIDIEKKGEFYLIILGITLGMMLMAACTHLLMLTLSIELVSILSFVLAGFQTKDRFSNEASLKYAIFGATTSGLMLYGLSLLYGFAGGLDYGTVQQAMMGSAAGGQAQNLLIFVIVILLLAGFAYKMAIFPMHMWSPDVYEGAPTPAAAFFTVAPKAAGIAAFIRFFYTVLAQPVGSTDQWMVVTSFDWATIIAVLAAITMTIGNLAALQQKSAKRLLAYSSIAHSGYIMMGLAVLSNEGLEAVLFYLVVYYLMNFGAFMIVGLMGEQLGGEEVERFHGLGKSAPFYAIILTLFLFSLTGIPPFAGFIGKVYLFKAVVSKELYWLAIVGVLNSVVSLFYYARLVKVMFLESGEPEVAIAPTPFLLRFALLVLAVPTLVLGLYWEPVIRFASQSYRMILGY